MTSILYNPTQGKESSKVKSVPTQRSQDMAYVLSGKMMARHLAWVHPTGGSLRVFKQFVWLGVGSGKAALSRPTHQRVTPTVSQPNKDAV
jgi:hypothetical protein